MREFWRLMEMFYVLIMVLVCDFILLSKLIKMYTKKLNFTIYKLYLNQ